MKWFRIRNQLKLLVSRLKLFDFKRFVFRESFLIVEMRKGTLLKSVGIAFSLVLHRLV